MAICFFWNGARLGGIFAERPEAFKGREGASDLGRRHLESGFLRQTFLNFASHGEDALVTLRKALTLADCHLPGP